MADIIALRIGKRNDCKLEDSVNSLDDIYSADNAEQRAQIFEGLGLMENGAYVFDEKKWDALHKSYAGISAANADAAEKILQKMVKGAEDNQQLQAMIAGDDARNSFNKLSIFEQIKNNDEQKRKFAALNALDEEFATSGIKGESHMELRDNQLLLRVDNVADTGLRFAIKDAQSIVFAKDQSLTEAQATAFAHYFDKMGMEITDMDAADKIRVKDNNDQNKEIGSLGDVLKSYSRTALEKMPLEELQALQVENDKKGITNPLLDDVVSTKIAQQEFTPKEDDGKQETPEAESPIQSGVTAATQSPEAQTTSAGVPSFEDELRDDPVPSKDFMKVRKAIKKRATIMGIKDKCVVSKLLPDGSYCISFYGNESDIVNDGKLDKDGIARHTKKVAFKIKPGSPLSIDFFIPAGGKFETGYAKAMLGSAKQCGYRYFKIPGAADGTGGSVFSAFMEAAGDQLMVPTGVDLAADNIRTILKATEDREKGSKSNYSDVIAFKMRLVGQLNRQLGKKHEDEVATIRDRLVGDINLQMYHEKTFPQIKDFINNGCNGRLEGQDGKRWSQVDLGCAYMAFANITKAIADGQVPLNHRADESEKIMQLMRAEMEKVRPNVIKTFNTHLRGKADSNDADGEPLSESAVAGKCNNAMAAIKDDMNRTLEKVAGTGSEYGKFELRINERGVLAPETQKLGDDKKAPYILKETGSAEKQAAPRPRTAEAARMYAAKGRGM